MVIQLAFTRFRACSFPQMDVPSMRWGGLSTVGSLSSFAAFDSFLASKSSGNSHQVTMFLFETVRDALLLHPDHHMAPAST